MILLPDKSYRTELKVNPKKWQTSKASIKKEWCIYYRLYPAKGTSTVNPKKHKLIVIKGMNHINIWEQRIGETKRILTNEAIRLEIKEDFINNDQQHSNPLKCSNSFFSKSKCCIANNNFMKK